MTDDVLDLDGTAPPRAPTRAKEVVSARLPVTTAVWVREQAWQDRCSVNAWVRRLIEREMHSDSWLPVDCREWLACQAAQCGRPGEPELALVDVIRHLARRWPDGARLAEPDDDE